MQYAKPRSVVQDIMGAIGYLEVARRRLESEDIRARVTEQQGAVMEVLAGQIQLLTCEVRNLALEVQDNGKDS
jgi:hypothetical protein